jgi:hypothetical protein
LTPSPSDAPAPIESSLEAEIDPRTTAKVRAVPPARTQTPIASPPANAPRPSATAPATPDEPDFGI